MSRGIFEGKAKSENYSINRLDIYQTAITFSFFSDDLQCCGEYMGLPAFRFHHWLDLLLRL